MIKNKLELLELMVSNVDKDNSVSSLKMEEMSRLDMYTHFKYIKQLKYDGYITSTMANYYITDLGINEV